MTTNTSMRELTLEEFADYVEGATIKQTFDLGHAVVHHGVTDIGFVFTAMNDIHGNTVVTESW